MNNYFQPTMVYLSPKIKIGKLKDNVLFRLPCEIYCLTFCHLFTEIILTFGTRSFYLLRRVIRQFSCLLMPEVILKKNLLDSLQILWQSKLLNIMELWRLNISAKSLLASKLWFFSVSKMFLARTIDTITGAKNLSRVKKSSLKIQFCMIM